MMDIQKLGDFYCWADNKLIDILEKISEEEFLLKNESVGRSIRELVIHMATSWEAIFLEQTSEIFAQLNQKVEPFTKTELLEYWRAQLETLGEKFKSFPQTVNVSLTKETNIELDKFHYFFLYTDHATYHRGQLTSFIKLNTDQKLVNTDYYSFFYEQNN